MRVSQGTAARISLIVDLTRLRVNVSCGVIFLPQLGETSLSLATVVVLVNQFAATDATLFVLTKQIVLRLPVAHDYLLIVVTCKSHNRRRTRLLLLFVHNVKMDRVPVK